MYKACRCRCSGPQQAGDIVSAGQSPAELAPELPFAPCCPTSSPHSHSSHGRTLKICQTLSQTPRNIISLNTAANSSICILHGRKLRLRRLSNRLVSSKAPTFTITLPYLPNLKHTQDPGMGKDHFLEGVKVFATDFHLKATILQEEMKTSPYWNLLIIE